VPNGLSTMTSPLNDNDTIAALATAIGGPVAIIRISGPDALGVAERVWRATGPLGSAAPRTLRLGRIGTGNGDIDTHALATYMPAPGTYTGEDTVEIHCHGGALSARLVLMRVLDSGARHAEPGEFTKRAFINGRMDLTQAEAVNDLITAQTEMAVRLANRQLRGLLGDRVGAAYDELVDVMTDIESRLDFPDEDIDWSSNEALGERVGAATATIGRLLATQREGEILRHGVRLVIAGRPNVGKSSLLNAILGRDRAIVTHIPGTTRDTLEELAHIRGIPLHIVDTAGIRESEDTVERSGIERSLSSLREAQIVLWVFDAASPAELEQVAETAPGASVVLVGNKADLVTGGRPVVPDSQWPVVYTCAVTGDGLDALFDAVEKAVWDTPHTAEPAVAVSERHAALLTRARDELDLARDSIETHEWELVAVSLRGAVEALGSITGRTVSPDILGAIFSKFCIGK